MGVDNWAIDLPCPDCRQVLRVTIGQLQGSQAIVCPVCKLTHAEARLIRLGEKLDNLGRLISHYKKGRDPGPAGNSG